MSTTNAKAVLAVVATLLCGRASARIRTTLSLMQIAKKAGYGRIAALCSRLLERHGLYLSKNAAIGEHIRLPHPSAIVIGDGVTIGDKVTIYQSVTLGGRVAGDWKQGNYPTISDGCTLFAGVVVVGKVYIGKNCVIGANSVVLSDIPDNAVAVGAPARVVSIRAASLKE